MFSGTCGDPTPFRHGVAHVLRDLLERRARLEDAFYADLREGRDVRAVEANAVGAVGELDVIGDTGDSLVHASAPRGAAGRPAALPERPLRVKLGGAVNE